MDGARLMPTAAERDAATLAYLRQLGRVVAGLDAKADQVLAVAIEIRDLLKSTFLLSFERSVEKHGPLMLFAGLVGLAALLYVVGAIVVSLVQGVPLVTFPTLPGVVP
jgi:hypothetical protein